jgi:hypothetical protein
VFAPHFGVGVINANPPVAIRILTQASLPAMSIRRFEMGQILKTHTGVTQDEQCIPE